MKKEIIFEENELRDILVAVTYTIEKAVFNDALMDRLIDIKKGLDENLN